MSKEWYATAHTPEVKPTEAWVSLADFVRMRKEYEKIIADLADLIGSPENLKFAVASLKKKNQGEN